MKDRENLYIYPVVLCDFVLKENLNGGFLSE